MDVLTRRSLLAPAAAPLATAVAASGIVGWTLWIRAGALQLPAYDTAFFEQVVWNLGHGRGFAAGYFNADFLGLHFSPLLVLPALLELAWPDWRLLGVLQGVAIGLSAPAAFLMLRSLLADRPGAGVLAAALAAPLPFWPLLQEAARSGFHTETMALPLVLTAAWAGLSGRTRTCWTCALLALAAREDQAYAVAVVGLLLWFQGPSRRTGLLLAAAALVWGAALELGVMPALRGPVESDVTPYYHWLRHPSMDAVQAALGNGAGWLAFAGAVAALAGLPLLRPGWLALALPPFLADLLSAHYPQPELHLQYGLPLVVPLLIAGGLGARRLLDAAGRLHTPEPAAALVAVPAVVLAVAAAGHGIDPPPAALGRLLACSAPLPAGAPLAADDDVAAPLAARAVERPLTWERPSDWLIIDRQDDPPSYVDTTARTRLITGLPASSRQLRCDDGRFQLWSPRADA